MSTFTQPRGERELDWQEEARKIAAAFDLKLSIRRNERGALFGTEQHFVSASDLKNRNWAENPLALIFLVFMALPDGLSRNNERGLIGFVCMGLETDGYFKQTVSAHERLEWQLDYRARLAALESTE